MKKQYCFLISLVASTSFCFGCSSISNKTTAKSNISDIEIAKHVISINSDGQLNRLGCGSENADSFAYCCQNSGCDGDEKYLNNIIEGIKNKKKDEVVLFIHGGLNNENDSIEKAKEKYNEILDDGKYPIFVIWNSGAFSTYGDHLFKIRHGEEARSALISSPGYFLTDVADSIVNAPKSWLVSGEQMICSTLVSDSEWCSYPHQNEKTICTEIDELKKIAPVYYSAAVCNKDNGESDKDKSLNITRRLQWLATAPAKVITTPFAHTMAQPAWDVMLRRTQMLFYTQDDFALPNQSSLKKSKEIRNGALFKFLDKFENEFNKAPSVKLTLVGHSMGAIVANRIVAFKPHISYKNIVHLASADSVGNFFDRVIPYIYKDVMEKCSDQDSSKGKNCKDAAVQFYSLSLHPDNENRESHYGGLVPSGSLLAWIDTMYTAPETVIDKRSGRWDNMKKAIKFIPEQVRQNMHFKIFGLAKNGCEEDNTCAENCIPQQHDELDNLHFWKDEVWWGKEASGI